MQLEEWIAQHFVWAIALSTLIVVIAYLLKRRRQDSSLNPAPLLKELDDAMADARARGRLDADRELAAFDAKYPPKLSRAKGSPP